MPPSLPRPNRNAHITALPLPSASTDVEPATVVLDDEGIVQKATDRVRHLLDLGPQSLTGQNFLPRVHPEDRPRILRTLVEIGGRGGQHDPPLLRLKTGVGPWQWFKLDVRPAQPDEGGAIVLRLLERGGRRIG